jgi:squalene-hopene/tetraprenyl-beta-curcumene cyclase
MPLDHPILRRGLDGLQGFAVEDDDGWRLQACMSPVWDTAWALRALSAAGVERHDDMVVRAVRWLLQEQTPGRTAVDRDLARRRWGRRSPHAAAFGGDWRVRRPDLEDSGGWAFEFANDVYPDIDDTAVVVRALREAGARDAEGAIARAVRWCRAMRSSDGAWASFDVDNTSRLVYRIPFGDFGALTDPPSEDVTAHVLEMLAGEGAGVGDPVVRGGLDYLRRTQLRDGSWWGRWGVNYVYGTWCVVSALAALGVGQAMMEQACSFLRWTQNADAGWGESCHSYVDPSFGGIGDSTPSQTAWAVLTFQAAGHGDDPAAQAGLDFLRDRQTGGTWDEPQYTGTGFPRDFYLNYHLYRHVFPTMALAMADPRRR